MGVVIVSALEIKLCPVVLVVSVSHILRFYPLC